MAEIWGLAAAAGISVIGGAISGSAQASNQKDMTQAQINAQADQSELNFERQDWLAQQQRAWQLQDRQYKQQAIAGFSKDWAPSGITPPNQNAELAQLNQFDPNKLGSVTTPNYGATGAVAPATTPSPLGQLAAPGGAVGQPISRQQLS